MRLRHVILGLPVLLAACSRDCPESTPVERVIIREVEKPCPPCGRPASETPRQTGGPEKSVLYHLADQYGPVVFTHGAHVGYADRCEDCHHRPGKVDGVAPCRECHGLAASAPDRPGLKGAYHRQCMDCHRKSGSGPLACEGCHAPEKSPADIDKLAAACAPKTAMLGHLAREFEPVRFDHATHAALPGTACKACHHRPGEVDPYAPCRECHGRDPGGILPLQEAYHRQCLRCHDPRSKVPLDCTDCHARRDGK